MPAGMVFGPGDGAYICKGCVEQMHRHFFGVCECKRLKSGIDEHRKVHKADKDTAVGCWCENL
jgi:hypothetical protein